MPRKAGKRKGKKSAVGATIPPPINTTNAANSYLTPEPTPVTSMAPNPTQFLDDNLRGTIQDLFFIQSNIHGYQGPATQRALVQNFTSLHSNLERIYSSAAPLSSRPIPIDVVGYIEEGRNPDIYTREFVELTQKGNRYLSSKSTAYAQFRDVLAEQMSEAWPEMKGAVERVLEGGGKGVDGLDGLLGGGNATRTGGQGEHQAQSNGESEAQSQEQVEDKSSTLPGLGMADSSS